LKFQSGVCQVYADQAAMDAGTANNYPCPSMHEYIRDMKILCIMIADGPL